MTTNFKARVIALLALYGTVCNGIIEKTIQLDTQTHHECIANVVKVGPLVLPSPCNSRIGGSVSVVANACGLATHSSIIAAAVKSNRLGELRHGQYYKHSKSAWRR